VLDTGAAVLVAGVVVLAVGLAVPAVVKAVVTGVTVPVGVKVDGVGVLVGVAVAAVAAGAGAAGSFDSQSIVTVTPPTTALLEAATVVFWGVCLVACPVGVASNSVYSGKVNPG
jgi:hypothetical protein